MTRELDLLLSIQRKPSLGSYAPIRRVLTLAAMLRKGEPCTSVTLAHELSASDRAIKRDIQFLRDLGWEIQWSYQERSYTLIQAPPARLI